MRRLEKAARRRGQTRQAFIEGAVRREIAEEEERRYLQKQNNEERQEHQNKKTDRIIGLGLSDRRHTVEEESSPVPTTAPVVVNVGNSGSVNAQSGDVIDRLAAYVLTGNDFDRDSRLRNAVNILHVSATTDEERKVLAARLDEAVAAKTKMKTQNSSTAVRVARIAFDKIFGGNE